MFLMRSIKVRYILGSALVLFFIAGCSSTKEVACTGLKPLPQSYNKKLELSDTSNIATTKWRKYFQDTILLSLIDTALKNNYDLDIAIQRIEMARANIGFSRGLSLPYITANVSSGEQKFGKYTMDGAGNNGVVIYKNQDIPELLPDYYSGLQASWEVDLWGKIRNKKKSAYAQFLANVEGKNCVLSNIISDVASNYYELLSLDNELDIINKSIKLQDSALNIVIVQKNAGVANELAVNQFKAQLYNSEELAIETMQKISESENNINLLLGRFPQPVKRDKSKLTCLIPEEMETGVPSDLLKNRPDIRQCEYEVIASKADVKAARDAFYPSLNITGMAGYQAFKNSLLFSPQSVAYNFLGSLSEPLINRSAIRAEFKTAKAAQLEALYNYQKSILKGYVEVYNQLLNYKNRAQLLEMKTKEVNILSLAVKSSIELFKTGRANYLEVLTAQQNNLQSQIELIDAQKQQYDSVIGVYKALGGGWR
jgi:outer membrane protein, multidrug efflux system